MMLPSEVELFKRERREMEKQIAARVAIPDQWTPAELVRFGIPEGCVPIITVAEAEREAARPDGLIEFKPVR